MENYAEKQSYNLTKKIGQQNSERRQLYGDTDKRSRGSKRDYTDYKTIWAEQLWRVNSQASALDKSRRFYVPAFDFEWQASIYQNHKAGLIHANVKKAESK